MIRKISYGQYETKIHRPVFDGLLWDSRQGFVQVDWTAAQPLPAKLEEDIDYDGDGTSDFRIELSTEENSARLVPANPRVLSLEGTYRLNNGRAVRVLLENTH